MEEGAWRTLIAARAKFDGPYGVVRRETRERKGQATGTRGPQKKKTGTKASCRQSTPALCFLYKCTFSLPGLGIRIKAERVLEARSYCALYFANHDTAQPSQARRAVAAYYSPKNDMDAAISPVAWKLPLDWPSFVKAGECRSSASACSMYPLTNTYLSPLKPLGHPLSLELLQRRTSCRSVKSVDAGNYLLVPHTTCTPLSC